ncbi:shikimate dehydrogenase [Lewinella sp. 4G2]|uniref:shikimate dehydrogenase family protein n=1 Tax=Lewinella sp. 4G2 TaxID=1803372 RepID=UPI0007B47EA3|nr:shikimate dehydrogenase [Lewinella sp. 4G2]OAV45506.1 shikimate dehydrogenase [Lewinella sp. 4G2]
MHKTTFGLIGFPITHSFSRGYFTNFFWENELDDTHQYLNFSMEDISGIEGLRAAHPGLRGINVTIPHKKAVVPYMDRLDESAERIGAVNCIRIERDGTMTGFNTDYLGFRADLLAKMLEHEEALSPAIAEHNKRDIKEELRGALALVLGTGGASLAVKAALQSLGMQVTSVSRTAGPNKVAYGDLTAADIANAKLIVNTTPLGMKPNVETFPDIPYAAIDGRHFAYDLVYNPEETQFLAKCRARGAGTANGLGMLHGQAVAGWDIWSQQ